MDLNNVERLPIVPDKYNYSNIVSYLADFDPAIYREYDAQAEIDRYYLTCSRNAELPKIALRLLPLRVVTQFADGVISWLSINVETSMLLQESDLKKYLPNLKLTERIEVQRVATWHNDTGDDGKTAFLVRGTQLRRLISNLYAAYLDKTDFACTFVLATEVVVLIVNNENKTPGFQPSSVDLIGHSLGGSAVQYVATDDHLRYRVNSNVMQAYSFNSIGTKFTSPYFTTHSFCGKYDFACKLGERWNRNQIGTELTFGSPTFIGLVDPIADLFEHGIRGVRKNICDCLDGNGDIEIK